MRLVEKAGHRHLLGEALQPVYLLDKGNLILLHFVQKKKKGNIRTPCAVRSQSGIIGRDAPFYSV